MLTVERPRTYHSVDETAAILGVSRGTILRWLYSGQLRGSKLGQQWRIREDDLRTFVDQRSNQPDRNRFPVSREDESEADA